MNDTNDPPARRPATGDGPSPDHTAPGDQDLPWKATPERRDLWGPVKRPLEGTVHAPTGAAVGRPRGRSRLLTLGIPVLIGGLAGVGSIVLGLGGLIAGAAGTAAVALGVGVLVAGGSGLLLRSLRPEPSLLVTAQPELSPTTRSTLESILRATAATRERMSSARPRASDPAAARVLDHVEALLGRIEVLVSSETIQGRPAYDGDVSMLEGMATRYLPELVEACEDTVEFLASFSGKPRQEALENLGSIDHQLTVLGEGIERIEQDLVDGVSRSLDVHAEFLRTRFADERLTPIIDV